MGTKIRCKPMVYVDRLTIAACNSACAGGWTHPMQAGIVIGEAYTPHLEGSDQWWATMHCNAGFVTGPVMIYSVSVMCSTRSISVDL